MADPVITDVKYSVMEAPGDGVKTLWDFNFAGAEGTPGYIDRAHVKIFTTRVSDGLITDIPVTSGMFIGPNTLSVVPAVPIGTIITIYRDTPKNAPLVNFTTTAILNEQNLDRQSRQSVYATAEMVDRFLATKNSADTANANALQAIEDAAFAVATSTAAAVAANASTVASNAATVAAGNAVTTANAANAAATNALSVANAIDGKAQTALDTAATANATANAATVTAGNAVTTANGAASAAATATSTANLAKTTADTAKSTADAATIAAANANTTAASAVTTANAASTAAGNAVTTANTANGKADTASANATTAVNTANAAQATANGIDAKATTALANANSALSIASTANDTANGIDAKATTALANSATAITTANAATATANGIDAKATSALAAANAALPKSGGNMTGDIGLVSVNGGQTAGFRNRVINGSFQINQQGLTSYTQPGYCYDRWRLQLSGTTGNTQLNTNIDELSVAVSTSVYLTTGVAKPSLAAGDFSFMEQMIEGYDVADLKWGTAAAKPITVQFRGYSTINGTVVTIAIRNGNGTRSYLHPITLTNTVQLYSFTVPGDTGGTWSKDNGPGLSVSLVTSSGTTFRSSTADAWLGGNFVAHTSQTNLLATVGHAFAFADIQVERGSIATPYESRPIHIEAAMCRRYFQYWSTASFLPVFNGFAFAANAAAFTLLLPPMRAAPSVQIVNGSVHNAIGQQVPLSSYSVNAYTNGVLYLTAIVSGGLTTGQGTTLNAGAGTGGFMAINADF